MLSVRSGFVHGLMLLMVILVASSFPVGAIIADKLPPAVTMCIRFLMAALLFAPLVFKRHGFALPKPAQLLGYIVLSLPLVAFFWCMFEALRYTSALNTGAIYTLVPAITAIYAFVINRETLSPIRASGLLLGTLGALWIVFRGETERLLALQLNHGDLVFFIGCLFMAAYGPLVKRLYAGEPMEVMTFWVISAGSVWLFLLSLPQLPAINWPQVDPSVFVGALYLAVFTTLITFFLLQFGTVKLGATRVAAYSFLTPVFVLLLEYLLGKESLTPLLMVGAGCVVAAMLLVQRDSQTAS